MADEQNPFMAAPPAGQQADNPFMSAPRAEEGFWEQVGGRVADAFDFAREGTGLLVPTTRVPQSDTATDIGRGIQYGVASTVQGLAELPAIGFDLAFDTNAAQGVSDFFAPIREDIEPETTAGRVAGDLTAFGAAFVPFAGWLSRAGQVARGTRAATTAARGGMLSSFMRSADQFGRSAAGRRLLSTRLGQYGTTALATGAFTSVVSPDGRATLSDSFDVLPDFLKTEEASGLRGRDEALRRIRNRLRGGAEDAIMSGIFDTTLGAFGAGARQVARVPQVAAAANAFNDGLSVAGETLVRRFPKATALARQYFTPSGGADRLLYEESEDAKALINLARQQGTKAARDYNDALAQVMKAADLETKNRLQSRQFEGEVTRYLEGVSDTLPSIRDEAQRKTITDALDEMTNISNRFIDNLMYQMEATAKNPALEGELKQRLAQEAFETLKNTRQTQGTHLRRVFEQYTNPTKFYKNLDLSTPLAKEAQQEIAMNVAAMEGRNIADEAVQERAKDILLRTLGLGTRATTKNVPEEQLVKEALEAARAANKGSVNLATLRASSRPEFVTDRSLFTPQEEMLTKSPKLRQLMGEVSDPVERYMRTVEDTVRTSVAENFYDTLPLLGVEDDLFTALSKINQGGRPAVVSVPDLKSMTEEQYQEAMLPFAREASEINAEQARLAAVPGQATRPSVDRITREDLVEQYEARLRKAGWVKLGEADATDVFGGLYGAASGKYVSPETYRAITQPLRLSDGFLSEVLGSLSALRNITQKMTIVPNPAAQIRNIFGNVGFLAGNANMPNGADITDLLYTFLANTRELNEAGLERLARKLQIAGVSDTSLLLAALKDYQNAADDLTFSGRLNQIIDRAEGAIPLMRGFEAVYGNTDTFFKGAALLAEEGKYANAFSRVKGLSANDPVLLDALSSNELLTRATSLNAPGLDPMEMMAAEIVKDTMPTYPRVVAAVRAIDAVPVVGNFTSFAAENVRNSIGTVLRGVREAAFEATPALRQKIGDQAANALEREIRAIGTQRLMAYTTVAYVVPKSLVKMSMMATNTTPEQMNALYEMNPEYLDGHDLVIIENNRDDDFIDYVDLSYVMPYAFMTDPAQAAIRQIQENGRAEKSMIGGVVNGMWRGFSVFADPFASETMFYERLRDVMPSNFLFGRGGVTATGGEIYGENESPLQVGLKSFNHLMFGFVPNFATMLVEERSGKLRPGRLLRAYTGTPDREGETTNPSKEIARLVTGFTPMRLNMRTDARYKGSEYLPLRSGARGRALATIRDAGSTVQSIEAAWNNYLDDLYRAQSSLYRSVEAMRTLGMSESEIRYSLINQAGLGRAEANGIIDGRFTPGDAMGELADDIRGQLNREGRTRVVEDVDFGALNRISADRRNEPLRSAPPREEPQAPRPLAPAPAENPFMQAPQANPFMDAPMSPQGSATPAVPLPNAPVVAPVQVASVLPVTPALLGDDPAEQAANMAIAQRTGRA